MVNNSLQKHRGVSLVEVLVAILVIGIGMLGVMGLQGRALQHSQQSYLNSQAVILANEMADKIRLNPAAAGIYPMNPGDTFTGISADSCTTNDCNISQLADWDRLLWQNAIVSSLPQGTGEISSDPVRGEYTIKIEYVDEVRASDSGRGDVNTFSVTVVVKI